MYKKKGDGDRTVKTHSNSSSKVLLRKLFLLVKSIKSLVLAEV